MSIPDAIYFWFDMIFNIMPRAALGLLYDTLGLPLILFILVVVFCWLGYRCVIMRIKK